MIDPKVSVIIVNWNGRKFLANCLDAIRKNTRYPDYEIVVVDNGSRDGSIQFLEKMYPEVKIIRNESNLGFAKANNQAIKMTQGKYLFLLNNDTEVIDGWLSESVKLAETDNKIGIIGSKIFFLDMKPQFMGVRMIPHGGLLARFLIWQGSRNDTIKQTPFIHGAAFLVRREVFEQVGLFDEGFFVYAEEGDLCFRVRSAGFRILYNPYSQVKHHHQGTTGESNYGYFLRNRSTLRSYLMNFSTLRLVLQFFLDLPLFFTALVSGRLPVLLKAYKENIVNIKDTWQKRSTRKKYTFR